jgi:hypothetical protein
MANKIRYICPNPNHETPVVLSDEGEQKCPECWNVIIPRRDVYLDDENVFEKLNKEIKSRGKKGGER